MYCCQLCIYLIGDSCSAFDIIKGMKPLEHFTHTFFENRILDETVSDGANVIFVNLQDANDCDAVQSYVRKKSENTQIILFADKNMIRVLSDNLSAFTDIWTFPMSNEEIEFHFLRWQKNYKMGTDFWQTNQYLEATINSVPNLIWYKDKEGIHRKVNDSFCKTVNKAKEQVEGRDHNYIWDVDPDDPENEGNDCMASDREVMEKQVVCVSEEIVKTGDSVRLMTTYKAPLYDWDGSVMGTAGVGIDITQERAYEEEIVKKNRTLETIFNTLECGVIYHTVDGSRILSINQAALSILGYETLDELVSDGFQMVASTVIDEDKQVLRECISKLKKTGDSVSVEYRVLHKDGEIIHVMGNIELSEENGELFYRRFLLDVTAQKIQERENERRQKELVKALSIDFNLVFYFALNTGTGTILRIDEESRNTFGSAFAEGISLKESIGCYIEKIVHEDDREMLLQACSEENLKKELERRESFSVNYRALINGEIKYHEIKVVRSGESEDSHSIVLGIRNVDEEIRNDMEQKAFLENALEQANMANKAKSAFLSNMSHDIRTPMNAIVGFTSLALNHIDNRSKVQEYLQKITSSGKHLLDLINDVLDMSRIESGKMQIEEASCNIIDIVHELGNIVQADVNRKQLNLIIDTDSVSNGEVYCDKLRLNQVLLNLISNSIKYTNQGGTVHICVKESTGASAGYADYQFCVEDTGIGMSKEYLIHIFEPFEREKNTTISGIQGTGLGMAITKNIVDMMNGSIVVESEQGVGTKATVSFTFRLGEQADKSQQTSEQKRRTSDISTYEKTGIDTANELERFRGIRILLAEDNELNQEIATQILENAGFEVSIADNGQIAVDMISASEPGYYKLVLMDVQMPIKNGYDATKEIRALDNKNLATIPILAMTANAFEEDKETALRSGMNGHIAKPIDVKKLFAELTNILGY
ncbi:MAG: response regulator [Lachnospiraceae bacterium]|nr:response regulator [Lachnospiraceae bacterium]